MRACMYSMHNMHTYIYWLHVIVSIYMYNHLHSKLMYTLIRTSCTNLALRYLLISTSLETLGLVPTWFILSQQLIPSWLPSQHCCRRWMYHNVSVYFSSEKCILKKILVINTRRREMEEESQDRCFMHIFPDFQSWTHLGALWGGWCFFTSS